MKNIIEIENEAEQLVARFAAAVLDHAAGNDPTELVVNGRKAELMGFILSLVIGEPQ